MDYTFKIESFQNDNYQLVDYIPHPKQKEFHKLLNDHAYNIMRKSRGMGGTTALLIEALIRLGLMNDYTIGYVSNSFTSGKLFLSKAEHAFSTQNQLPSKIIDDNRNYLSFDNGSELRIISDPDNLCGIRPDWLIFDDCFELNGVKQILDMARRTESDITLVATPPEGVNPFKRYYYGAITNTNEYIANDYMWYDHPFFSKDMMWVRGNVEIPYDNSDITTKRLLEFGFHRESPSYTRYLKMFGRDYSNDMDDIETYARSSY